MAREGDLLVALQAIQAQLARLEAVPTQLTALAASVERWEDRLARLEQRNGEQRPIAAPEPPEATGQLPPAAAAGAVAAHQPDRTIPAAEAAAAAPCSGPYDYDDMLVDEGEAGGNAASAPMAGRPAAGGTQRSAARPHSPAPGVDSAEPEPSQPPVRRGRRVHVQRMASSELPPRQQQADGAAAPTSAEEQEEPWFDSVWTSLPPMHPLKEHEGFEVVARPACPPGEHQRAAECLRRGRGGPALPSWRVVL